MGDPALASLRQQVGTLISQIASLRQAAAGRAVTIEDSLKKGRSELRDLKTDLVAIHAAITTVNTNLSTIQTNLTNLQSAHQQTRNNLQQLITTLITKGILP